jgi:hypothetical protein
MMFTVTHGESAPPVTMMELSHQTLPTVLPFSVEGSALALVEIFL